MSGVGLDRQREKIEDILNQNDIRLSLKLAPQLASAGAWLYENGQVTSSFYDEDGHHHIIVTLSPAKKQRFIQHWPEIDL